MAHRTVTILCVAFFILVCATSAHAICLAPCHDHCIGTCSCIAHPTPDCNCNIFGCNCDCCKQKFCSGTCFCQNSAAALSAPADPAIPVCSCGSCCGRDAALFAPAPTPGQRFQDIDTNHDGKISFDEMVEYMRRDPELKPLLQAFTADELRAKYFTPLDKNGDGVLEPEELDRDLAAKPHAAADGGPFSPANGGDSQPAPSATAAPASAPPAGTP